jgi:hypothetical protein
MMPNMRVRPGIISVSSVHSLTVPSSFPPYNTVCVDVQVKSDPLAELDVHWIDCFGIYGIALVR